MTAIINLRQRKKQAARAAARKAGDENAARHSQPSSAHNLARLRLEKEARALENHRRERPDMTD